MDAQEAGIQHSVQKGALSLFASNSGDTAWAFLQQNWPMADVDDWETQTCSSQVLSFKSAFSSLRINQNVKAVGKRSNRHRTWPRSFT